MANCKIIMGNVLRNRLEFVKFIKRGSDMGLLEAKRVSDCIPINHSVINYMMSDEYYLHNSKIHASENGVTDSLNSKTTKAISLVKQMWGDIGGREDWDIYLNGDNTETHFELFMSIDAQNEFLEFVEKYKDCDKMIFSFISTQALRSEKIDYLLDLD